MKPIKLTIKGLNSFIDEQTIDFETLTERGFFGIFGPTGSGKSTILDGITLALYGKMARNSSNFINTNCNSMSVSFEFQISGAEIKKYIVQREFKRDNKTGGCTHGKVKLMDISSGEESPKILADKVGLVNSMCNDIIGLNVDDFTRTVVLPQGKFSEFLTLTGKDRRDMLERLFDLRKYGDGLSQKLGNKIGIVKTEFNKLAGKMSGYEDISEEILENKKVELGKTESDLSLLKKKKQVLDKSFEEWQQVWNYQKDLEQKTRELEKLKSRQEDINLLRNKVALAESALKVYPYVENYEKVVKELEESRKNIHTYKEKEEKLRREQNESERRLLTIRRKKEIEIPELIKKEQAVVGAIEENKIVEALNKDIDGLNKSISILREKYKEYKIEVESDEQNRNKTTNLINSKDEKLERLKIDDELKEKVQEGLSLTEKYEAINKIYKGNLNKIKTLENSISLGKKDLTTKDEVVKEKKDSLVKKEFELKSLIESCPGEQKDLNSVYEMLMVNKEKWDKFNNISREIQESIIKCERLIEELDNQVATRELYQEELSSLEAMYNKYMIENMATTLRKELKQGDECPVCGAVHHINMNNVIHNDNELANIYEAINSKKKILKGVEEKVITLETTLKGEREKTSLREQELEKIGEDFKELTVEQLQRKYNNLEKELDEYAKNKESLEKIISSIKEELYQLEGDLNTLRVRVNENEKQLNELLKENGESKEELDEVLNILNEISETIGVKNFKEKHIEINETEKEISKLTKEVRLHRVEVEELRKKVEEVSKKLDETKLQGQGESASLSEKMKNRDERIENIKNKVGECDDLNGFLEFIQNEIKVIEEKFKLCEETKEKLDKEYGECNEKYISYLSEEKVLASSYEANKGNLFTALINEGFDSDEEVKNALMPKEELVSNKTAIDQYNEGISMVRGAIEDIKSRLGERSLSEEKWVELQEYKIKKEEEIAEYEESRVKLGEEVKNIITRLGEHKGLLEKKKDLEHKLGLLSDLEKLFKGKKFVEFIATNQLKYVSLEASKKLKDISGGNYGLEVDEDGKFIIRDYKNGGAERDASTLSGGETFLASLSLALALSSQIQLKGTAPLELFFLDEGFGTLDENLLEVVMGSLEKIHHDKLRIGLISHVESIKNRIPVKLVITPAEAGRGGSKVKIERS